MSQLILSRTGPPAEVLELHPQQRPVPRTGEVLVRMQVAAINPADLNFIEGTYGKVPELPCVPGMEGCGVIEELGKEVCGLIAGALVLPLESPGAWAQWRVLRPERLYVLPHNIDPQQAALLRVNPPTAWGLLHAAGPPAPGAWIAQNAASSAAGHCVIQVAKSLGLKTINFVRRPQSIAACRDLGADLVFMDDPDGLAAAKATLAADRIPGPFLALNAVGGDSALRLLDFLGMDGTLVTYGAMARRGLKVPNGMLIFKTLVLRGFWLTRWQEKLPQQELIHIYGRLCGLAATGRLHQQIAAVYPVADYRAALEHAARNARNGKVLLTF